MAKVEESGKREVVTAMQRVGIPTQMADLDPLFRASNRLFEGWMAVGTEMLEFGKNRLDQNIEMGKAFAQTTSLKEAMDLQTKFTRSFLEDYLNEANKLADLGTRSWLDSLTGWQQAEKRKVERAEAAE
jgi:hypothetical protein